MPRPADPHLTPITPPSDPKRHFAFDATVDGVIVESIPWVISSYDGYLPLFDAPTSISFATGSYGQMFTAPTAGTLDSISMH